MHIQNRHYYTKYKYTYILYSLFVLYLVLLYLVLLAGSLQRIVEYLRSPQRTKSQMTKKPNI